MDHTKEHSEGMRKRERTTRTRLSFGEENRMIQQREEKKLKEGERDKESKE